MLGTAAWSILPAWAIAIAGAIAIALTPLSANWTLWVPVACGLGIVIALGLQVATRTPEGFNLRASVATVGVVIVFAVLSLILVITG